MGARVRGAVDQSSGQELGGLDLGDVERARGKVGEASSAHRLERPIMQIRLDQIAGESPIQSRETSFDPQAYPQDAELLASVREHGILEPIMVARDGACRAPPTCGIVFGHRPRAAAALAGMETIPAIIARRSDDLGLLTLAENTGGRTLSSYERALAKHLGTSQGMVSNLLAAYGGSTPALRGLFAEGMDARAVVELQATFARLSDNEQVAPAGQLRSASQQTVRSVKELIEAGVAPQAAAVAVGAGRSSKNRDGRAALDGADQLRALAEQTGAPLSTVRAWPARRAG